MAIGNSHQPKPRTVKTDSAVDIDRGLFDGLTVVELGQYIAAPYAAELLANGGAEVTSIEPVQGSATRFSDPLGHPGDGRQYVVKARGKTALPLAISTAEGQEILHQLLSDADVVITNLRVPVAERLGLTWGHLSARYPRLIYAEVRGFGESGPLADAGCVDIVAQAASGLLHSVGRREEGRSKPPDVMFADYHAGALLAFGIAAALYQRHHTGRGQRVATSLLASALSIQHRRASRFDTVDQQWHHELHTKTAAIGTPDGEDLDEIIAWRDHNVGTPPFFYNVYRMADGELAVGAVAANGPHVLRVAGLEPDDLDGPAKLHGLTVAETTDLVAAMFANRAAGDVVNELRARGVPAAPVQFLEEAMTDPDLISAGLWQHIDHARLGSALLPSAPLSFSDSRFEPETDTPEFGAHTDQILRQLGYDDVTIERLVADGIIARGFAPNGSGALDTPPGGAPR